MRSKDRIGMWVAYGAAIWLVGAAVVRLAGEHMFVPDWRLVALYAGAVPLVAAVTLPAYERVGLTGSGRMRAAVAIVAVNAALDAVALSAHGLLFPALDHAAIVQMSAWLLWCYGLIVSTGLVALRPRRRTHAMGGTR